MFDASGKLFLSNSSFGRFITLSDEKLIFARRKSLTVKILPLIFTIFSAAIFSLISSLLLKIFLPVNYILLLAVNILILQLTISLVVKIFIDWYFRLFIITNRKLLDISYHPFFSHRIKDMPLDQVRCLEIGVRKQGILREIMDIGDVTFKLDMLTHHDTFTISDISAPHKVGIKLGDTLNTIISSRSNPAAADSSAVQLLTKSQNKTIFKASDTYSNYSYLG